MANTLTRNYLNNKKLQQVPNSPKRIIKKSSSLSSLKDEKLIIGKDKQKNETNAADQDDDLIKKILNDCGESRLEDIFTIELRAQKFTEIPQQLIKISHLRVLDISSNEITKITNLQNFSEMKELKLYDNLLTEISGLDKLKELQSLQLQHNRINRIGQGLQNNKKLKSLRIDGNLLKRIDANEISSCCSQLTILDVSFNELIDLTFVINLPYLEELYACKNRLTVLPNLSRCRRLIELDLSDNELTDIAILKNMPTLQRLDVSNNKITKLDGVGPLGNLLSFNIEGNLLRKLADVGRLFPRLDTLNVARNQLQDFNDILDQLTSIHEMEDLTLRENPCSNQVNLKVLLVKIPTLRQFDGISVNKIDALNSSPLMRPMTASHGISTRIIEQQLTALRTITQPFEENLQRGYENLCEELDRRLPRESAPPTSRSNVIDVSRATPSLSMYTPRSSRPSRRRLDEALEFSSIYSDNNNFS